MKAFSRRPLILSATVMALLLAVAAPAQQTATQAPAPSQDSPRSTMFTFLDAVNAVRDGDEAAITRATACLDLSREGADPQSARARTLIRHLWSALNHIRLVEETQLPGIAELGAEQTRFVYFPRAFDDEDAAIVARAETGDGVIALARMPDGRWLFDTATVAGLDALAAALETVPRAVDAEENTLELPDWVREVLPKELRDRELIGLRYWQWFGLLILIFLGIFIDYFVRTLSRSALRRLVGRLGAAVDDDLVVRATRWLGLVAGAVVWVVLVRLLSLTGNVREVALSATGFYAVLVCATMGMRMADLVAAILMHVASKTRSKFDDILVPLFRKTAKVFIFAFGVVYGAQNLNINIVPLITGLGIGGLAFAFAAKDTIENFFGSIAVILDRPFEVGDWVVVGDVEGTVEELGFRSTRIRTFYNSQVTVPNATLVRATVDNLGRRQYRRWKTYLGVQYDTPPERLLAFTEGIRELVRQHPYTRHDFYQVWCNDFADYSLNILLYVFFAVPDWSTELRERERLFVDIVRLADRLGVQFAFPTQTLHLYKEEHAPYQTQYDIPRGAHDGTAKSTGVEAARAITSEQDWQTQKPGPMRFDVGKRSRRDSETGGDS